SCCRCHIITSWFTLPAAVADIAGHDRSRPQAPRRPGRRYFRPAHVGLGTHPSSARPHDGAGRGCLARRQALGVLPARLLFACARTLTPVPPTLSGEAHRRACRRTAAVLWRSRPAHPARSIRRLSEAV